jgi:hypothetical protein
VASNSLIEMNSIVTKKPAPRLEGHVECDEVYIVAGHKGRPEAVEKKGGADDDGDSQASEGEERLKARGPRS